MDEEEGLILINVINMKEISFETEAGILRPVTGDKLYHFSSSFADDAKSDRARSILSEWPLYTKNPPLQMAMRNFMESGFAPEQILDLARSDNLKYLFVPIQQKFKIGKFEEKINWNLERKRRFEWHLENMRAGDHITYIAFIPPTSTETPLFYSVGTKPHESTVISLKNEPFNFKPDRGGHIRCIDDKSAAKKFVVDAGSSFIGKGHLTSVDTAKAVTRALSTIYRKHGFTPVAGRGAFSGEQSY
jgi:hypothetical protein